MIITLIPVEMKTPKEPALTDHQFIIKMMILGHSSVFTALSHSPIPQIPSPQGTLSGPRAPLITHESAPHLTSPHTPTFPRSSFSETYNQHLSHITNLTATNKPLITFSVFPASCCLSRCHGLPIRNSTPLTECRQLGIHIQLSYAAIKMRMRKLT